MNNNKLPVIALFMEAFTLPFKYSRALVRVGLPLIATILMLSLDNHLQLDELSVILQMSVMFFLLAFCIVFLMMAVIGCHRIFLLGEHVVENQKIFHWTGNEIKYAGWWVLILLGTFLVSIAFGLLMSSLIAASAGSENTSQYFIVLAYSLISIPIYYIPSRWSLVLPAAAISNHGKSLSWSWDQSSGNGWRLTLMIAFLPFLMNLIFSLLPYFDSVLYDLIHSLLWLIVGVIEVGLLSLSYRFLAESNMENIDERAVETDIKNEIEIS